MIVRLAESAELDLERIGDALAAFDAGRALAVIRDLRRSCMGLGDMPLRYPLVPHHEASGLRRRVHRQHLIFYKVDNQDVLIVRILHGAMDYEAILFPTD
jgi:toxin ParE1/3/4